MTTASIPSIQTIRYMGSKRKLLDFIVPEIRRLVPRGGMILDLLAGANSVSYAMKKDYRIITNDIQEYSWVIANALILSKSIPTDLLDEAKRELESHYTRNYEQLASWFNRYLEIEASHLANPELRPYKQFYDSFPYYNNPNGNSKLPMDVEFLCLFSQDNIKIYKKQPERFPYLLFSTYFANGYFGIRQSLEIDSLRYAIDKVIEEANSLTPQEKLVKKSIYLTSLMSAMSKAVSGTGHFAQFHKIDTEHTLRFAVEARAFSIKELFYQKLGEFVNSFQSTHFDNICLNEDYTHALEREDLLREVDLVYVDPPYSNAHYSRFYHVLETLVKYDYPDSTYIGRYRDDRYQSGFCRKGEVRSEFRELLVKLSRFEFDVVISYVSNDKAKNTSNVFGFGGEDLIDLCRDHYLDVEVKYRDHRHQAFGNKKARYGGKTEYLILCPSRNRNQQK